MRTALHESVRDLSLDQHQGKEYKGMAEADQEVQPTDQETLRTINIEIEIAIRSTDHEALSDQDRREEEIHLKTRRIW